MPIREWTGPHPFARPRIIFPALSPRPVPKPARTVGPESAEQERDVKRRDPPLDR